MNLLLSVAACVGVVFAAYRASLRRPRSRAGDRRTSPAVSGPWWRRDHGDDALIGALDAMARSIRAGAGLPVAFAEARDLASGTQRRAFDDVLDDIEGGASWPDALREAAARRPTASVTVVWLALLVGLENGGELSAALDEIAESLRLDRSVRREVGANVAQAKASALVVGLAPVGFVVVLLAMGPDEIDLFGHPLSEAAVGAGLTLDLVGVLWMRALARSLQ